MLVLVWSGPAAADEWQFSVEPYLFASNIDGDTSVGRVVGVPIDMDFGSILERLDVAGMLHFEAHGPNGWGVALDYGFMDLSDDIFGSRGGVVDARNRQGVLEGLLIRQLQNRAAGIEVFAGFRWWDNDIDVRIDPAVLPGDIERKVDASWIDLVIGARWTRTINAHWDIQVRGDVGGFGVEADFTSAWQLRGIYRMSDRFALDLQYKATWVDFEDGRRAQPGYYAYDTVTHGPVVGLIINF